MKKISMTITMGLMIAMLVVGLQSSAGSVYAQASIPAGAALNSSPLSPSGRRSTVITALIQERVDSGGPNFGGLREVDPREHFNNDPVPSAPNWSVSIVKYTNGQVANDPNGADVPFIAPGATVTWTYKVTNTGSAATPASTVIVTDDQTGVTPVFDHEISGNGDTIFDPGEVWLYKATGIAVNLSAPPAGVKVVPGVCTMNGTIPPSTAYVNQGTVTIPDATSTAKSSYCNPRLPSISIVKYTNGQTAIDPNGADVPLIKPGDPVVWTYQVTNTGQVAVTRASVTVTDDQPGVTPVFDHEVTGNGDTIFDPGEVWLYKASGSAVDLSAPPAGVKVVQGVCTQNQTQLPRTAYVNQGTASIPGATSTARSSYCNPPIPSISIVKYTNGQIANDPNGADVPFLPPGAAVEWTYKVTNTGQVAIARTSVSVTDDQPGVTPVFDHEITGNGDTIFDPGEVWLYKASGTAVILSAPPAGVKVIQGVCTLNGTRPPSTAYVNQGTVTIPGATSTAKSSYCNSILKIYLPLAFGQSPIRYQGWQTAVSFEDLPLASGANDFDYNDWVTDIDGVATFDTRANDGLSEITFVFSPHARGAAYEHAFHVVIPHGTFGSNGTAVLTLLDKDHNVLSTQTTAFVATADNDFVIFPKTSDVFPALGNTVEGYPYYPPQRYATLIITFTNLVPFNLSAYNLSAPHGEGLFFDPYLHVVNTGDNVHRGDIRMLTVPSTTWLWPEETIRIDKAYPDITFIPGNPPTITFPDNWWLHFNHCVYDGFPCVLPHGPDVGPAIQSTLTVTPP